MAIDSVEPHELGYWTDREITSQPASWRRVDALAASARRDLGGTGERLLLLGCGTSYYIGGAFAALRERAGLGESDAFIASQVRVGRRYDRVVGISRSGTTADLVSALQSLQASASRVVVSAVPRSPAADAADKVVDLGFADEKSVVQTRFATTTLALLRGVIEEDVATLADQAEQALSDPLPDVERYDNVVFLAHGWAAWLAAEAGLKLREMAGATVESYLAEEYEHGPVSAASEHTLVWGLGPLSDQVQDSARRTGATILTSARDPMAELVRIHRFGLALARHVGIDCDTPPFLRRSVA